MCNIIFCYLHILWNNHHSKSRWDLSPCVGMKTSLLWELLRSLSNFQICNIVLLTIVTILCLTSPWFIYIKTMLVPFYLHSFCHFTSCLWQHQSVLCISELGFCCCWVFVGLFVFWRWEGCCFVFKISHISEIMQYLPFSELFHLA